MNGDARAPRQTRRNRHESGTMKQLLAICRL
jgi:hypothetical protein